MRAIVAVAGALALVAGGAAAAAQADVDAAATQSEYARQDLGGDAFNSAAATVTFRGPGRIDPIDIYVRDRACNGRATFAYMQIRYVSGPGIHDFHGRAYWDDKGCRGAGTSASTSFVDGFDVWGARVAVCHDNGDHEAGTGDPCSFSAWMTNPHV